MNTFNLIEKLRNWNHWHHGVQKARDNLILELSKDSRSSIIVDKMLNYDLIPAMDRIGEDNPYPPDFMIIWNSIGQWISENPKNPILSSVSFVPYQPSAY